MGEGDSVIARERPRCSRCGAGYRDAAEYAYAKDLQLIRKLVAISVPESDGRHTDEPLKKAISIPEA